MSEHKSDCAIHNAPALEPGPCDCGADGVDIIRSPSLIEKVARAIAHEEGCSACDDGHVCGQCEADARAAIAEVFAHLEGKTPKVGYREWEAMLKTLKREALNE